MTEREIRKIFKWIVNIIDSCENSFHLEAAEKIIELFYEKTKEHELTMQLKVLRKDKLDYLSIV